MRLLLAALLLAPLSAAAQPAPSVEGAWARATPPLAQSAAAYLVVHGVAVDRITGVSTPVAAAASLHRSAEVGGVMQMRPLDGIALAPGQAVTLAPGGYHVMLTGLKQPLRAGEHFPLTMTFEHAPPVTTQVQVERIGATAADPAHAMHGMTMP